jgi:hypothetical protein
MLKSSTPDGMAPIDSIGLISFISSIGGLSMIWGLVNLIALLSSMPEGEHTEKMERVILLNRKMIKAMFSICKVNLAVGLGATLLFFILIMVTRQ